MIDGDALDAAAGAAVPRGSDFWYTVLAAYLPADTAADAANSIGADLFTPADSRCAAVRLRHVHRGHPGCTSRVADLGRRMGRARTDAGGRLGDDARRRM